ncbi:hypothetical protein KUTeg_023241 [Tegillarca granosa]|uniref:Uncharacterized protein n=1 Tax=Tegillarca granosa TaxID=220873 RepID=A0ABQ9E121_TEGGR|nr:hypothetical protein KUTeg_023241 [Tegillarca granosa]
MSSLAIKSLSDGNYTEILSKYVPAYSYVQGGLKRADQSDVTTGGVQVLFCELISENMKFMRPWSILVVTLFYIKYVYSEDTDSDSTHLDIANTDTSNNKLIRNTRGLSSFVRIGKDGKDNVDSASANKRMSSFMRIGKSLDDKRMSSFMRIGKSLDSESEPDKRMSSFMRIGKSFENDIEPEKRLSSFMRIGKSLEEPDKRMSSFMRIGKSLDSEPDKRMSSFMRIGKSVDELEKRPSAFMRIGKSGDSLDEYDEQKRMSSFMRIGKSFPRDGVDKRLSSFMRIGKNIPVVLEDLSIPQKKMSSFMRIGKSLDDGQEKRMSSFMRIGKNGDEQNTIDGFIPEDKSSDLSEALDEDELDSLANPNKRISSFVRIGRSVVKPKIAYQDPSSLVRIGRSIDLSPEKRNFIRIGKIPSSAFMRIGRRPLFDSLMKRPYVRVGRLGHSSFIRIGKRDTKEAELAKKSMNKNKLLKMKRMSSFMRIGKALDHLHSVLQEERMNELYEKDDNNNDLHQRYPWFIKNDKHEQKQTEKEDKEK